MQVVRKSTGTISRASTIKLPAKRGMIHLQVACVSGKFHDLYNAIYQLPQSVSNELSFWSASLTTVLQLKIQDDCLYVPIRGCLVDVSKTSTPSDEDVVYWHIYPEVDILPGNDDVGILRQLKSRTDVLVIQGPHKQWWRQHLDIANLVADGRNEQLFDLRRRYGVRYNGTCAPFLERAKVIPLEIVGTRCIKTVANYLGYSRATFSRMLKESGITLADLLKTAKPMHQLSKDK